MALFNSGAEAVDRLFARHLVDLGLPSDLDPIVWIVGLTVVGSLAGVMALKWVESRIGGAGAPRRLYRARPEQVGTLGSARPGSNEFATTTTTTQRGGADPLHVSHHYHLRVEESEPLGEYSSYAEASQAIASMVDDRAAPWEIIRTDDRPDAWIDVLSGAGSPDLGRHTTLRHYPPAR